MEKVIWYFFLYSVLGYVCEVLYCSIPARRFVNRGFLHGPYIPVYGFGGVAGILLLSSYRDKVFVVFLLGMVVSSVIEYIAGFFLEHLFHVRLWDYRDHRFQIRGRVCLSNAVLFGLLILVVIYGIHPIIEQSVGTIPERLRSIGASGMLLVLAVDTTASVLGMVAFTGRLAQAKRLKAMLDSKLEIISQGRQHLIESIESEIAKISDQLRRSGKRIFDAFPGIKADDFEAQLVNIRMMIAERRTRHKNDERKD